MLTRLRSFGQPPPIKLVWRYAVPFILGSAFVNRVQGLRRSAHRSRLQAISAIRSKRETLAVLALGRRSCRFTRRSARLAVNVALVLITVWLLFPAAAMAEPAQSWASTGTSVPNGLVVVIENKAPENKLNLRALNNPYISGVALQIHWSDLEPVEGNPDWSKLDQLFAAAESSQNGFNSSHSPGFSLLHGLSRVYTPKCFHFSMDLAKAQSRSFRCLGTTST
jgi:hypothetical protein